MCGIAGVIEPAAGEQEATEIVRGMLESMRYRGPDALGIHSRPGLALGNVRLAIQGIDATGNQPIFNETGTVAVVFNGEIYNYPELRKELEAGGHRFSTHTDTEVLAHLFEEHGVQMADRLNGMFAFAVHDLQTGEILLGRDKTAQKPFFTHRRPGFFGFASELKALLAVVPSPRIHPGSVLDFLGLGYALEPKTVIEGVETLEPGTVVRLNDEGRQLALHRIPFPDLEGNPIRDAGAWIEEAASVFESAVERHTLSDVPISVFLSGGVDSSLVALLLARAGKIRSVQSGSFHDSGEFDEFRFANEFAGRLGVECDRVDLGKKTLSAAIGDFCRDSSQPQGDYSGLPSYVLARATSQRFRVVLGGDGGDELFAGYPTYTLPALRRRFGWIPRQAIAAGARAARFAGTPRGYLPLRFRLELLSQAWGRPHPAALYQIKNFLPPDLAPQLLNPGIFGENPQPGSGEAFFEFLFGEPLEGDSVRRLGRLDFHTFLRSCTLPKMERNCMRWSLENRLPFLDNEVIDLASRTDESLMIREGKGKWCLRKLLEKELENLSLNPRKQGFAPPLTAMLDNELREWSRDLLATPHPLFRNNVGETLDRERSRGRDLHRLIWNICILKDWTMRNGVSAN